MFFIFTALAVANTAGVVYFFSHEIYLQGEAAAREALYYSQADNVADAVQVWLLNSESEEEFIKAVRDRCPAENGYGITVTQPDGKNTTVTALPEDAKIVYTYDRWLDIDGKELVITVSLQEGFLPRTYEYRFGLWLLDMKNALIPLTVLFVVLTLLYCVLFPGTIFSQEQGEHDFIGFLRTKNNEAAELSVGILFQIAWFKLQRARREIPQRWELMLFVVQGMMLFLCNAKGALFCVAIPAAYLLFVEGRNAPEWRLPLGLVYVVGSVGFLIAALTILPLMEPLLSAIGKDATLTGRTPLWRQIILVMTNSHTFTGYGFGMFWRDRQAVALLHTAFRSNSFMGTMTTGAHNVLLEYWLNVGLFGLASYFIALLASFRQMRKLERQNYIFCAAYMLWFMVMGWTERSMSTYEYQMVFLFLAMGVGSNKPRPVSRRRARLEKEAT